MLQNIVYILPELSLLAGIVHLYVLYLLGEESSRMFARIARIWVIISMFCMVVFYNQSLNPHHYDNNSYTFLFRAMVYVFTYIVLCVSPQYFAAEKHTGCKFAAWQLLSLSIINIMLAAVNIVVLSFSYCLLALVNYRLMAGQGETVKIRSVSISGAILLLLISGTVGLYILTGGATEYASLAKILQTMPESFSAYMCVICLLIPFLYALGIAPFHSFAEDKAGRATLPVSHYQAVVTPWAYWGVLIKLNTTLGYSYADKIAPVYVAFALFSVVIGAMGTNSRINLHRIYSFTATYYFGIILLLLAQFKIETTFAAYICLTTYICGVSGAYLVFYVLKSRNEYLASITSLSGLSETRPLATATLLISLFSLIGMPPLAGFLGQADIVSELIAAQRFISLGCVMFCLLLLAKAFLEMMKTAYFEHKIINYDVENKTVHLLMLLNIAVLVMVSFNPFGILDKIKDMFYALFL